MLSEADRLRGLFRLGWAVQTHFANFDLVPDLDWEQAVIATAPAVERAESLSDFYGVLQRLVVQLRDGHTFVAEPDAIRAQRGRPDLEFAWIEEQPVITWAASSVLAAGARPGMVVVTVDERSVGELLDACREEVSASTEHSRQALACQRLLVGPYNRAVSLVVDDGDGKHHLSVPRSINLRDPSPPEPSVEFRRFDRAAYIAVHTFQPDDVAARFDEALDSVLDAPALVLDLRRNTGGNGGYARAVAGRLTGSAAHVRTRTHPTGALFVRSQGMAGDDAGDRA